MKGSSGFCYGSPEALFCYVLDFVERQAIERHAYVSLVQKVTADRL